MTVRLVPLIAERPRRVLTKNPKRLAYTIKNDSTVNIFVGHDSGVATSGYRQGYLVPAGGGVIEDRWHKGEVWVICTQNVWITVAEDLPIEEGEEK